MSATLDFLRLVEHHAAVARPLPWRQTRDPYAILVSEIMLQQTRVETVLRYYAGFLERFPDWAALADADPQDLLAAWAGLGYYRRARSLQATARAVLERGGRLPEDEAQLRTLPGLGPYTAAAMASIAFNRPALALDGNALRVLLRYFGLEVDPTRASVRRTLAERVLPDLPAGRAGDFTQALIELGATLCASARPPSCCDCPLAGRCVARNRGLTDRIPRPRRRPSTQKVYRAAAILVREGHVLLGQDQRRGLLEGLWEFPGVDLPDPRQARSRLESALTALGLGVALTPLGEIRHAITFRDIRCQVFAGRPETEGALPEGWAWVEAGRLEELPLPSSTRRILALAGEMPAR